MKWAEIAHHDIDEKGKRSKGESGWVVLLQSGVVGRSLQVPASIYPDGDGTKSKPPLPRSSRQTNERCQR